MMEDKVQKIQEIIAAKVTGVWEARHEASGGHRYFHNPSGYYQRSVTTKLGGVLSKPHLIKWGIRIAVEWLQVQDRWQRLNIKSSYDEMMAGAVLAHTDVRDDAGSVGGQAHSAIERWINQGIADGEMPEDITKFAVENADTRAIAAMRSVQKLFKDKNIIPICSEILVGDIRYSAGQLDFLCFWEGVLTLVDWKSSNNVSQDYILQAVAYKKFLESMTGLKIKKVKIAHISKDSDKYTIYKVGDFEKAWKAFKAVCFVYDWKHDKKSVLEKDIRRLIV